MIRTVYILSLLLFSLSGVYSQSIFADSSKTIEVGLDVIQSIPSFIFREKYFIRNTLIIEPSLRVASDDGKVVLFALGYAKGTTLPDQTSDILSSLKFGGTYFRIGFEKSSESKFPLTFGYGPIVSFPVYSGKFRFEGPVFGDYEGDIGKQLHIAAGAHLYLAANARLGNRFSLRLYHQLSVMMRLGELRPIYYPGVGFSAPGELALLGINGGVQLFYRLR